MKKVSSSLWSSDEETKKKSKLDLFCRILDKKKILKYNAILVRDLGLYKD